MAPPDALSADERHTLAGWVREDRRRLFITKRAAYNAAELNSATWDRIEAGLVVREDRLVAALRVLWPRSGGDPRVVLGSPALRSTLTPAVSSQRPTSAGSTSTAVESLQHRGADPLLEQVRLSRSPDGGITVTVPAGTPVHIYPR